jgi:uncharacterized protein (TIGR02186 family)
VTRHAIRWTWVAALAVLLACVGLWTGPSRAEPVERVIAGLSQTQVSITTGFSGSEIFIYGAIERNAPVPKTWPLDIIVTVTGPLEPVIVRKKEHKFGIWVNDAGVRVDAAPSFYAVSTTGPLDEIISFTDDLRYKVKLDHLVRYIGEPSDPVYKAGYPQALVRLRHKEGTYFELIGGVKVTDETLFETRIRLPANLVEGDYKARIFLLRDKHVLDEYDSSIAVRRVGLERWIYNMAHQESATYGLLSILVALGAGWLASTFFRMAFR